jgi:hypothetical protein
LTLPPRTASPIARAVFGDYFSRRLIRAGFDDFAAAVDDATGAMLAAARSVDDLERPTGRAVADRDEADQALDDTVRLIRVQLAGRAVGATKEAPYTNIFPKGVDYYTGARLGDQRVRYEQLMQRLETWLSPSDPIRAKVPALQQQLVAWLNAEAEVGEARNTLDVARTRRDNQIDAWIGAVERAYGLLVARVGRTRAEQFFPKGYRKTRRGKAAVPAVPPVEVPAPDVPTEAPADLVAVAAK